MMLNDRLAPFRRDQEGRRDVGADNALPFHCGVCGRRHKWGLCRPCIARWSGPDGRLPDWLRYLRSAANTEKQRLIRASKPPRPEPQRTPRRQKELDKKRQRAGTVTPYGRYQPLQFVSYDYVLTLVDDPDTSKLHTGGTQ